MRGERGAVGTSIEKATPDLTDEIRRFLLHRRPPVPGSLADEDALALAERVRVGPGEQEVLLARRGKDLAGALVSRSNEFDTSQFGIPVKDLQVLEGSEAGGDLLRAFLAALPKPCYIATRVPVGDASTIAALEDHGFRLLAVMLDLVVDMKVLAADGDPAEGDLTVDLYRESDLEALRSIAGRSFTFSRFHAEGAFPRGAADRLHQRWVENCCHGGLADQVFVARIGGHPVGFHAVRGEETLRGRMGRVVLIAADGEMPGRGIGTALVRGALAAWRGRVERFRVRTEAANRRAVRVYERCGFLVDHASIYYSRVLR